MYNYKFDKKIIKIQLFWLLYCW